MNHFWKHFWKHFFNTTNSGDTYKNTDATHSFKSLIYSIYL